MLIGLHILLNQLNFGELEVVLFLQEIHRNLGPINQTGRALVIETLAHDFVVFDHELIFVDVV